MANAQIVSGPQMLRGPALAALRRWKYEPSTLNGQPIAVQMLVTIKFSRNTGLDAEGCLKREPRRVPCVVLFPPRLSRFVMNNSRLLVAVAFPVLLHPIYSLMARSESVCCEECCVCEEKKCAKL